MRQCLEGLRTILLGSYNRLDRNVGVLFAYFGFAMLAAVARIVYLAIRVNREIARRKAATDEPDPGPMELNSEAVDEGFMIDLTTAVAAKNL